jgi:hypothetical protein
MESPVERLAVSRQRNLSIRICTWPRFPHNARQLYKILRRFLTVDQFALISRVHDVIQRSDGKFRLDIWIDDRTNEAHQVAAAIQEQLPHRWHTRYHIPYHTRLARDRGLRIAEHSHNQPRGLTVASWNIRSFWPKKASILWLLQKNNVDIFAIQETWCSLESWAPKLPGYTVHSVPSGPRGEVGLALAVRNQMTSSVLEKTANWIIVEIRMENGVFIVANIYFPSGGLNHTVIRDFEHALDRYASNILRSRIVILGDFNRLPDEVDQLCWRWSAPVTRLTTRGSSGTFHGYRPQMEPSAIDHMLFGPSLQIQPRVKVLRGWSDSDHWPIITTFPSSLGELPRPVPKKVYSRTFSDLQRLNFIQDNRWEVLVDQLSDDVPVEAATSLLLETFNNIGNAAGRIVETMGPSDKRPSLSHSSRCAIRHRTQALQEYLSTGNDAARSEFFRLKDQAKQCLKQDAKKRWERKLEELREAVGSRNNKRAWSWINGFMKPPRSIQGSLLPAIFDESGSLQTSEQAKEAAWLAYYRRLFDDTSGHSRDPSWWLQFRPNIEQPQSIDPLSSPLDATELLRLLGNLKNGKAPGVDKIPPEWFKILRFRSDHSDPNDEYPNKAVRALSMLYQSIIDSNSIPECWRTSEIVSIPKSGDMQRAENYRGIALIPVGLKLLCTLIINRFNRITEENSLIRREQAGFRSREECIGQVVSLLEIATRRRTLGARTYMAFIDLKKAYDMVPHEALFAKLEWAGFDGNFLSFLRSLYEDIRMQPRGTNDWVPAKRGLRQGCPMSPSLFNFFINDLFEPIDDHNATGVMIPQNDGSVLRCPGLMFADDIVVLAESAEGLKQQLTHIDLWTQRWGMECGVRKCAVMLVLPSHETHLDPLEILQSEGPWLLNNETLPLARQYRYLGYEFTDDLSFKTHLDINRMKAKRAFATGHRFLTNKSIPLTIRNVAYKAMVLPILSWGSEVLPLDRTKFALLSQTQNQQIRMVCGLRPTSSLGCPLAIGRELNIPPFWVRAATSRVRIYEKASILKTWLHILCQQDSHLPQAGSRPWIMLTRRWLNRKLADHGRPTQPIHRWIRNLEWSRSDEKAATISMVQYVRNGYIRGRQYLLFSPYDLTNRAGMISLLRLRTGSFLTIQRMAQMRLISPEYFNCCPFCGSLEPETIEHLLTTCSRWVVQRAQAFGFDDETLTLFATLDLTEVSVLLLGGEIRGENGIIGHIFIDGDPITLFTIAFLESIMFQRLQVLNTLRQAWPPRVNAPTGTTVLEDGTELTGPGGSIPQGVLVGRNPTYPELG